MTMSMFFLFAVVLLATMTSVTVAMKSEKFRHLQQRVMNEHSKHKHKHAHTHHKKHHKHHVHEDSMSGIQQQDNAFAAGDATYKVVGDALAMHEAPKFASPLAESVLNGGEVFHTAGAMKTVDGMWLQVADGRGWLNLRQDKGRVVLVGEDTASSSVPVPPVEVEVPVPDTKNLNVLATDVAGSDDPEAEDQENAKAKDEGDDEEEAEVQGEDDKGMDSMKGSELPEKSRHKNHKTMTKDWRAEVPEYMGNATANETERGIATRLGGISALVSMVWLAAVFFVM